MGSPIGISWDDGPAAPLLLLDVSCTLGTFPAPCVAAAALVFSPVRCFCFCDSSGLTSNQSKRWHKQRDHYIKENIQAHCLPDDSTGFSLANSCPRLLGTTSRAFSFRRPAACARVDTSRLTLQHLCKGNTIIRVRIWQCLWYFGSILDQWTNAGWWALGVWSTSLKTSGKGGSLRNTSKSSCKTHDNNQFMTIVTTQYNYSMDQIITGFGGYLKWYSCGIFRTAFTPSRTL